MNERIKQLAEQAGLEFDDDLVLESEPIYYTTQTDLEKFAELIIQEYKQEWVGLTTDELKEINDRFNLKGLNIPVAFRTVESALRDKNLIKWDRMCYKCKSLFCDLSCNLNFGVEE